MERSAIRKNLEEVVPTSCSLLFYATGNICQTVFKSEKVSGGRNSLNLIDWGALLPASYIEGFFAVVCCHSISQL